MRDNQFGSDLSLYDNYHQEEEEEEAEEANSFEPIYNEKAIDVPEAFEREAYARLHKTINSNITASCNSTNRSPFRRFIRAPIRQLSPTLKDFLQVSIDTLRTN